MVGKRTPSWWVSPLERHVQLRKLIPSEKNPPNKALLLFRGKLWVPMKPTQTSTTWMSEVRKYIGYVMSPYFCVFIGKKGAPISGAPPEIHPTSPHLWSTQPHFQKPSQNIPPKILKRPEVWILLPLGIDNAIVRPFAVLRLFRAVKLGRLIRKYRRLKILWNLFQALGVWGELGGGGYRPLR